MFEKNNLTLTVLTLIVCGVTLWLSMIQLTNRLTSVKDLTISSETSRIVVVGNGPSIIRNSWGSLIDSFDIVVRFNAAKIVPEHTGTKTSIHILTAGSLKPHHDGAVRGIVYNHTLQRWLRPMPCVHCLEIKAENAFAVRPTSGLVTIAWLVDKYPENEIRIVGFDGIKSRNFSEEHYYESTDASRTWSDMLLTNVGMHYHPLDETKAIDALLLRHKNAKRLHPNDIVSNVSI